MRVIFIASPGRSGSTILDRLLGSTPEAWSGGELARVWGVVDEPGRLCSCGQTPRRCVFWRAVLRETLGTETELPAARVARLFERFHPGSAFAVMLSPLQPEAFRRELREYTDVIRRFYAALVKVGGKQTIVDSSKSISYAWLLGAQPGMELDTIHLVRDSRAVAYSWTRTQASSVAFVTRTRPVFSSAYSWNAGHFMAELLRLKARRFLRLRYEDFAREPAEALSRISRHLDLPLPSLSEHNKTALAATHMVTGNPLRFQAGEVAIREDDEWKRRISSKDAALVTSLTWPLLLRHGYPLRFR